MDLKEYSLNDGKNEIKLTKVILDKNEWDLFLYKMKNGKAWVKTGKNASEISQIHLNQMNKKKCVPLIENNKLFNNCNRFISVVHGDLGNLYFRLYWALNACSQTSEYKNELKKSPEDFFKEFIKWWKSIKNTKLAGYIALSKTTDSRFKINDMSGFIAQSINYDEKTEIKDENDYDKLHIKYITPWVLASEICLYLSSNSIINLPDDKGFMTIK